MAAIPGLGGGIDSRYTYIYLHFLISLLLLIRPDAPGTEHYGTETWQNISLLRGNESLSHSFDKSWESWHSCQQHLNADDLF